MLFASNFNVIPMKNKFHMSILAPPLMQTHLLHKRNCKMCVVSLIPIFYTTFGLLVSEVQLKLIAILHLKTQTENGRIFLQQLSIVASNESEFAAPFAIASIKQANKLRLYSIGCSQHREWTFEFSDYHLFDFPLFVQIMTLLCYLPFVCLV